MIAVKAWTDWSTGKPRPVFNVEAQDEDGSTVEAFKTVWGARQLESELKWVAENIDKIADITNIGTMGFSLHALYAMVYLAAARAGVNPAHVSLLYDHGIISMYYGLHELIASKLMSLRFFEPYISMDAILDPHYNIVVRRATIVLDFILKRALYGKLPAIKDPSKANITKIWEAIDAIAQLITAAGGGPGEPPWLPPVYTTYIILDLSEKAKMLRYVVQRDIVFQGVQSIYRRAAKEARDPDVRRLANLLEETTHRVWELAKVLSGNLNLENTYEVRELLGSPETFSEGKKMVLEALEKARDEVRAIEHRIDALTREALEIIEKLKNESILLPCHHQNCEE